MMDQRLCAAVLYAAALIRAASAARLMEEGVAEVEGEMEVEVASRRCAVLGAKMRPIYRQVPNNMYVYVDFLFAAYMYRRCLYMCRVCVCVFVCLWFVSYIDR